MSNPTTTRFRQAFANREEIDATKWWSAAQPLILEEVNKALMNEPSELRSLAEYLAANCHKAGYHEIYAFLMDTYGFYADYQKAWQTNLGHFPTRIVYEMRFYRNAIANLTIPAPIIFRSTPNLSKHWERAEAAELHRILGDDLLEFERETGKSLCEYYFKIEDEIASGLEGVTGISAEQYRNKRPSDSLRRGAAERRAHQDLSALLAEALRLQLNKFRDVLSKDFSTGDELLNYNQQTIKSCCKHWKDGVFFLRMEFLYRFVYFALQKHNPSGLEIGDVFADKRALFSSLPLLVADAARDRRINGMWRNAENTLRQRKALPLIGLGWTSEARLLSQIREAFPCEQVLAQATPQWLGRLRFDVYFPDYNIAVEYQGLQHFNAITHFGGQTGLAITKSRDKLKRRLCAENCCRLVEVLRDYNIGSIVDQLRLLIADKSNPTTSVQMRNQLSVPKSIPTKKAKPARAEPAKVRLTSLGEHDIRGCARHGTGELIRSLAAKGTNFAKLQKKYQDSLLFVAASAGNLDTLHALVDVGLDIDAANCQGKTVLARFCYRWGHTHPGTVRALLEAGSDLQLSANAFLVVKTAYTCSIELTALLVEFGSDINISEPVSGMTAFLTACAQRDTERVSSEQKLAMLRWLVKHKADPHVCDRLGRTAFDIAVATGSSPPIDYPLFLYLMSLRVRPSKEQQFRLYRLEKEYENDPTDTLNRILVYARNPRRGRRS